jgi:hypothetical protein
MTGLELTLTVICVILPELVPATLDSLSSSKLRFFIYESVHVQEALKYKEENQLNSEVIK